MSRISCPVTGCLPERTGKSEPGWVRKPLGIKPAVVFICCALASFSQQVKIVNRQRVNFTGRQTTSPAAPYLPQLLWVCSHAKHGLKSFLQCLIVQQIISARSSATSPVAAAISGNPLAFSGLSLASRSTHIFTFRRRNCRVDTFPGGGG
ncbi:hypothetical protein KCP78_21325 [Salmonella enterica subsp. enterica]|nr:hypothetical protein KCP78_21325 [Salmonella enterica subsp. enterica]